MSSARTFKMYQDIRVKLRGLLDPDELQVLDNLNDFASEQSLSNGGSPGSDEYFRFIGRKLKILADLFEERAHFMQGIFMQFPEWERNRKECIKTMSEIAESLNKIRYRVNISKMFCYSFSLSGGIMLVASGASSSLSTDKRSLAIAGGMAGVAGSLAVWGLTVSETTMWRNRVQKAKILLIEDSKHIQDKRDRLHKALQNVLDIDIDKDVTDTLRKFVDEAAKINDNYKKFKKFEQRVNGLITKLRGEKREVPVAATITIVQVAAILFFLLGKTENRFLFDFVSLSSKSAVVVASLVEHFLGIFNVTSVLKAPSLAVAAIAVGTVGMALDAIGIVKTSMDILRGSSSPEARKITEAIAHLDGELAHLNSDYQFWREFRNLNAQASSGVSED